MRKKRKLRSGFALFLAMILVSSLITVQPKAEEVTEPTEPTEPVTVSDSEEVTEVTEVTETELEVENWNPGDPFGSTSLWFGENGKIFYDSDNVADSPNIEDTCYLKTDSTGNMLTSEGANASDYNISYDMATATLTFHNLDFTCTEGGPTQDCDALCWNEKETGKKLKLVLEGENKITAANGAAIDIAGSLDISGSGTLTAVTNCTKEYPDDEDPSIVHNRQAICVIPDEDGTFSCKSRVTCIANNTENIGLLVGAPIGRVSVKGGEITGNVALWDYTASKLVSCDTSWSDRSGIRYVGRTYYYMRPEDEMYPNLTIPDADLGEKDWRIVGKYDENGNPIPSTIFYQDYYLTKNGDPITNDFYYPVMHLVYGDTATVDAGMKPTDMVSVGDGKKHIFNTDLYHLILQIGDVTVNGNIILDFSCFEQYERVGEYEDPDGNIYNIYGREADGTIKRTPYEGCSVGSKAVINGNVGLLSLYKSFEGNVIVNGDVNLIGYYDDINAEDKKPIPEMFYGAKVDAGSVIENGNFVASVLELEGYKGYCVFDDVCYSMTVAERDGEVVQGTSAPIAGDGLFINVGSNGIDEMTFPCVRKADDSEMEIINNVLEDPSSKVTAMDIKLVRDNTDVVEPTQSVNLYIDNLTGYKNPALFHIRKDGVIEKLFAYTGGHFGGTIQCQTSSFSTYFVAEDQDLSTLPDGPDTWKDKEGTEGFVLRLYNLALLREAEDGGNGYWTEKLQTKSCSAAEVAKGFFFSDEFEAKKYTDKQFVTLLYNTLLGREPDSEGMSYWLKQLKNGVSREYIFKCFAESSEFTGVCKDYGLERGNVEATQARDQNPALTGFVSRLYTEMLGRGYDEDGLNYWCNQYLSGESIEQIASDGFLHSAELNNQKLTNEEFVTKMYYTFLDREPDKEGYAYWVGQLNSKKITREILVNGFIESKEFNSLKTEYGIK